MNPSTVYNADLVTREQAAQMLGITPTGLKRHILAGRLTRADDGGRAQTAWYRKEDVEALRGTCLRAAWLEAQHTRRAALEAAGEKPCTTCGIVKPFADFPAHPKGIGGRDTRCTLCTAVRRRSERQADPERYRAYYRAWEQAHPDKVRAKYRRQREKHGAARRERQRAWCHAHRDSLRERQAILRRMRIAVEEGKASPICRRIGFSLVSDREGRGWRAARLDKPLFPGESAHAVYEWSYGRWVITAPALPTRHTAAILAWAHRRAETQSHD